MKNLERAVVRVEARLRKRFCAHEKVMVLQWPLWMRTTQIPPPREIKNLTEPVPSKPIAKKCVLCGIWLPVANPFEPSHPPPLSNQCLPPEDEHVS